MDKNYYLDIMDGQIAAIKNTGIRPRLLLHSCCAPCSSSVLELLLQYFDITVYYYNPNIFPDDEYAKRAREQVTFCKSYFKDYDINVVTEDFDPNEFYNAAKFMEREPEGGKRCTACYSLRLEKTARYAKENGFDYFTTTLSVSPLKDAARLNTIGGNLAEKYGVRYLVSDFKKRDGYKRSCDISKETNMYRQSWCGCKFSYYERLINSAKGYIFDLDGTLTDTMVFYETYSPNLVRSFGKEPRPSIRDDVRLMTSEEVCEYVVKEYGIARTPQELLEKTYELLEEYYGKEAKLKCGVKEFLEYAKRKGKKLCIASATAGRFIELVLKSNGVYELFEFCLSCPDLGMYKDKPDIYVKAAEMMGLTKDEVLVFEDAHHAVLTAKSGGLKVVGVYDECAEKFEDIIKENSDIYVNSMKELVFE